MILPFFYCNEAVIRNNFMNSFIIIEQLTNGVRG